MFRPAAVGFSFRNCIASLLLLLPLYCRTLRRNSGIASPALVNVCGCHLWCLAARPNCDDFRENVRPPTGLVCCLESGEALGNT